MEYIVLRVQVKFDHSLFRWGWLWVGDNICLLWDYLCLLCPRILPVFDVRPKYQHRFFLFMSKISFEGHKQILQKISCGFKTWMEFVRQIMIKLKTSSIRGFLQLPFDALLGVTYANMLVATQWPLKHTPHLSRSVCCGGLEAHWTYLRYAVGQTPAPSASHTNFTESIHKYIVQMRHVLLDITVCGLAGRWRFFLNNHVEVTHSKRAHDPDDAQNGTAQGKCLLVPIPKVL